MASVTAARAGLHGARALRLAPRSAGTNPRALGADGLVRCSYRASAPDVDALERAALVRRDLPGGRRLVLTHRTSLVAAARTSEAAALALLAVDAAAAPPPPPRLVGVLNVTPDSFSDGGQLATREAVVERGRAAVAAGAELLDVGGESTRPGAEPVGVDEELARVTPALEALRDAGLGPLSIDTRRAAVAAAALDAGATVVNDVEAGTRDAAMLPLVAARGAGYVAMHMRGEPRDMQDAPHYDDVVDEVAEFLRGRLAACVAAGIAAERVWLDPGIGFGKDAGHNLALLAALGELRSLGRPLFVGVSRKRFIGALTGERDPARRAFGTAGAVAASVAGGAEWLRVHDVGPMRAAARVAAAVRDAGTVEAAP